MGAPDAMSTRWHIGAKHLRGAIAAYAKRFDLLEVRVSQSTPGDVRRSLPAAPPRAGESFDDILRSFEETIVPGITHWNHPAFFGYFATSSSGPGILAEMLARTQSTDMNYVVRKTYKRED